MIHALAELGALIEPELLGWLLCTLRILPVVLLCPVLGGQLIPASVRLVLAGALGLAVRPLAGPVSGVPVEIWARCAREAGVGLALGLGAALPFDGARIGGRLIDLVRGTSAEAALPVAGHRESATADLMYQLLVCLALAGGVLPATLRALGRSYLLLPPGTAAPGSGGALALAGLVGTALATGLSIAAPVVALSWATDAAVGLALRAAPGLPMNELGTPVRILGGATLLWLSLGVVSHRLLAWVLSAEGGWVQAVLAP
ncbi:MAG: EscT/YscT/HrcT family type III secretion system export apparatus protein [Myxococcaceae bacterium]